MDQHRFAIQLVAEEIRKTEEEFRKAATQAADTQASSQPGKYNITYDFPKSWSPQSFEPEFGASITATLSPNGKHIVVVTTKVGEKKTLLLDGKEVVKCDDIQSWWFNPQGQLEYIAKDNGKCVLVIARGKSEEYESISPLDENIPGLTGCSKFLCTKS